MTPRTFITAFAVAFVMFAGSRPAYAQVRYDFTVPFNFVANGRAFTAGQYMLVPNDTQSMLILEARDPKNGAVPLPVETRIAEHQSLKEPEVIFDKLNGQLYASELLVPGGDGYLFLVTKAKHTHESVKAAPAKK